MRIACASPQPRDVSRLAETMIAFHTRLVLYAALASLPLAVTQAASEPAWTRLTPVYDLAGAGDILVAATAGGVVFWDLSSGQAQGITTAQGPPTQLTLAASLAPDRDQLCLATTNGIARGWVDSRWSHFGAQSDEKGLATYACTAWPGGRCIAGGDDGLLVLWGRERADSLRVPTRTGRVVALGLFTSWIDRGVARQAAARAGSAPPTLQHTGEPVFPVGLVAALDNDGVWLLHSSGTATSWLHFSQEDGLPSHITRDLLADSRGRLWVATDAGLAWIGADLAVHAFPGDALLAQRVYMLHEAGDGFLYMALERGVARLELAALERGASLVLDTERPVIALTGTADTLWWSDGEDVASLAGSRVELPVSVAASSGLALAAVRDSLWVGHPGGLASVWSASTWERLGRDNGLPTQDVISFLHMGERFYIGTAGAGLFERISAGAEASPRMGDVITKARGKARFAPVAGAPAHAAAQAYARGQHWVGGNAGLHVQRDGAWQDFPLWGGAAAIVDLLAVAETLWASAGHAGVAFNDGRTWTVLPRSAELAGAFCGRLSRSAGGRLVVATDRGLATWSDGILCHEPGFPVAAVTAVAWWGGTLACGTQRGLWLRDGSGTWTERGVLEGLPGAQIRALAADASGALWVGTTRGLGRLWTTALPSGMPRAPAPQGRSLQPLHPGDDDQPTGAWLGVYDVRGRLLRRLDPAASWDGRDGRGQRLAHGVYFLRQERSAAPRTTRKLLLR